MGTNTNPRFNKMPKKNPGWRPQGDSPYGTQRIGPGTKRNRRSGGFQLFSETGRGRTRRKKEESVNGANVCPADGTREEAERDV